MLGFAGWKYGPDAMPDFYRSLDVFVLPSKEPEPFGLVVLEAMASGLPVIATAHGGPAEILRDNVTGVLVTPGDPAKMMLAMRALSEDPGRAKEMGAAGRTEAVNTYDIARTMDRLQQLYDGI